jgi:Fe-Mn family superoxide dismutase
MMEALRAVVGKRGAKGVRMTAKSGASGLTRREVLGAAATAGAVALAGRGFVGVAAAAPSAPAASLALPPLPYAQDALAPTISARTISFHYDKHHRAYVENTAKAVAGTPLAGLPLEDIVRGAAGTPPTPLFNNAAQAWNHAFYWRSLAPRPTRPGRALERRLAADLGGLAGAKRALAEAATTVFGSGWAWLVLAGGKLAVVKTANADTPLVHGQTPLLALDVWEHAYYLDYQNRRPEYVQGVLDRLLNWDFAGENLARAGKTR